MPISTYATGFNNAYGLAFDSSNNLYVADYGNNDIVKVDTFGNSTVFVSGFSSITNLIMDNQGFPTGFLYAVDSQGIYQVSDTGGITLFYTIPPVQSGNIFGLAFDSNNNLYYSNYQDGTVYRVDPSANATLFITGLQFYILGMNIHMTSQDILYICNQQDITTYDTNGALLNPSLIHSDTDIWLNVLYNEPTQSIYTVSGDFVTGGSTTTIQQYSMNGILLSTIYSITISSGIPVSSFGIAVDSLNNLYFATDSLTVILKYTAAGPMCFHQDTDILTSQGYRCIQELRNGDLVKTWKHEYQPIAMIGVTEIYHDPNQQEKKKELLYHCSPDRYPENTGLYADLIMTGCHCVLVDTFESEEQRKKTVEVNGKIYVTDKKYRLPVCVDDRATVYDTAGLYKIYHLALEHDDERMNYGIYANGLLVETCAKRNMKQYSNMKLL